jgi:hypothetical protein
MRFPTYVNLHRQNLYAALHEKNFVTRFLISLVLSNEMREADALRTAITLSGSGIKLSGQVGGLEMSL